MIRRLLFSLMVCGVLLAISSGPLRARQGVPTVDSSTWKQVMLPTNPAEIKGFTCLLETINASTEGYLPIRITAKPTAGTFPGDRLIRVQVKSVVASRPQTGTLFGTSYSFEFMLPAGAASARETFYLPKYFEGGAFEVRMSDLDGPLRYYEHNFSNAVPQISNPLLTTTDWLTRFTVILPDAADVGTAPWAIAPDLRSLESFNQVDPVFATATDLSRLTHDESLAFIDRGSLLVGQRFEASDCPRSWLGYESSDVVLVSFEILKRLKSNSPEQYEALRQWLSTGGVIWTYGVPGSEALAKYFEVRPYIVGTPEAESLKPGESPELGLVSRAARMYSPAWRQPRKAYMISPYQYNTVYTNPGLGTTPQPSSDIVEMLAAGNGQPHPAAQLRSEAELESSIFPLMVEAGAVVGFRDQDPFPGTLQDWFVAQYVSGAKQSFQSRRGISVIRGSNKYWTWLLSNVARPPVYAFLTFLTLFVLLVGPVAYYLTRRAGRGYLMFLIAPTLATITTLMLFGYGFVADGFNTKVRMRQITWIDGLSGRGSQMNRATYFTAFRPAEGLRFGLDTAVYPVLDGEMSINMSVDGTPGPRVDRRVDLASDAYVFRGEFLPSRTQAQFVSYQPIVGAKTFSVKMVDGEPQLTNTQATILRSFFVCLPNGQYYRLLNPLPPGETSSLVEVEGSKSASTMRLLYMKDQPETPLGYTSATTYNEYGYLLRDAEATLAGLKLAWKGIGEDEGIYEDALRSSMTDNADLKRNHFIAVVDVDETTSAVSGAEVLESVHYIMGTIR